MIDVYLAKGPNPLKILFFLEEAPLEHRRIWLDLTVGDHRTPEFLKLSPSAKTPAMVDHAPASGPGPASLFESGAILIYLAEKAGKLLPQTPAARADVLKWLVWQVATFAPMSGQAGHFLMYAPKDGNEYARTRYENENRRLYEALDRNLAGREFIADEFSIADIALFPWVFMSRFGGVDVAAFPNVAQWLHGIQERPAAKRALEIMSTEPPPKRGSAEEFRKNLFHDHCDENADAVVR